MYNLFINVCSVDVVHAQVKMTKINRLVSSSSAPGGKQRAKTAKLSSMPAPCSAVEFDGNMVCTGTKADMCSQLLMSCTESGACQCRSSCKGNINSNKRIRQMQMRCPVHTRQMRLENDESYVVSQDF